MSKEQKDAQPPTLPPASEQSSNHISHVLDFGHGEGGNMQPKVERDQEPAFKKRKLDSQSGISSNNDQFSTGPDLVSIECETSKNLSLECQASKDVDSDSQISMIIEDQNHRPESPVDIEKTMASSHNAQVFEIIDDLGSDREEYYESEDDYDDDDIDALLDECLDKPRNTSASEADVDGDVDTETDPSAPEEKEKVVLIEKGHDPFEVLPEGWVTVTHNSGIPVYLHKQSRVCTLAKPYFLGPGSARKHDIPVSAIPCLQYRKELEKESMKQDQNGSEDYSQDNCTPNLVNGTSPPNLPSIPVKVMSVEEKKKETILDHKQLHEYCQKLFQFKTITVRRFKTWKDRRKHQKQKKKEARPSMPESAKLITCPLNIAKDAGGGAPSRPKAYVLSPHGKSYVCILQEYVQHTMKLQPKYIFQEIDNSANPHRATVVIDDIEYGSGLAKSKKQAKLNAAKETLNVLIPEMKKFTEEKESTSESLLSDVSFYDEIRIEDPRVYELSQKTGHPSPYEILLVCLNRNQGMGDTKVKMTMNTLKHQKVEFTMTVGKHTATVPCKNKREGKQLAAQSILKLFHPYVYNWGSILRLYSVSDKQVMEEKKQHEDSVLQLARDFEENKVNKPNYAMLEKLKKEMDKLSSQQDLFKSKGKLHLEDGPNLPSSSVITAVDLG